MSVECLQWVFSNSDAKGADRLILLAIADHCGEDWMAWPSIKRIARHAQLSEQTVKRRIRSLVDDGYLERFVQGAPDERIRADRRSNLYRLVQKTGGTGSTSRKSGTGGTGSTSRKSGTGGTSSADRGVHPDTDGGYNDDATGGTRSTPKPSVDPSLNRQGTVSVPAEQFPSPSAAVEWKMIWDAFPRKTGSHSAHKAFKQAKRKGEMDVVALMSAIGHVAATRSPQYCPALASFISERQWVDWIDGPPAGEVPVEDRNRKTSRAQIDKGMALGAAMDELQAERAAIG